MMDDKHLIIPRKWLSIFKNPEQLSVKIANGFNVNQRDAHRRTLLMHASDRRDIGTARILVGGNADILARDINGWTALHHAAGRPSNSMLINFLIEAGAPLQVRDVVGDSPLIISSKRGFLENIVALIAHGSDLDARNGNGESALTSAAHWKHSVVIERLLRCGADVNTADVDGWTPLMYSANMGDLRSVTLELYYGANPNAVEHCGNMPLVASVWGDSIDVCQLLLPLTSNLRAINDDNEDVIAIARKRGNKKITALIKEELIRRSSTE